MLKFYLVLPKVDFFAVTSKKNLRTHQFVTIPPYARKFLKSSIMRLLLSVSGGFSDWTSLRILNLARIDRSFGFYGLE